MSVKKFCLLCNIKRVASSPELVSFYYHTFVNDENMLRHLPLDLITAIQFIAHQDPNEECWRYVWMAHVMHLHSTLGVGGQHVERVRVLMEAAVPENTLGCVSPTQCGHVLGACVKALSTGKTFEHAMEAFPVIRDKEKRMKEAVVLCACSLETTQLVEL